MSCRADLRAFQDMGIVLENSMSAAQFELVVQRKAAYFYNNFVLTVCLLTAVSWLTFRMDPVSEPCQLHISSMTLYRCDDPAL